MLNVKVAKDDLARQLLPLFIEELYIELSNELINYSDLINKKNTNNKKIENILAKLSTKTTMDDKDATAALKVQRGVAHTYNKYINNKMDEALNRMLEILRKIMDGKRIDDISNQAIVLSKEYKESELDLIEAYVSMRKNAYKIIEYIGYYIVKRETPKDKLDKVLFTLAIESLKVFDIDSILKNPKNYGEIAKLMNIINKFFVSKEIDMGQLRDIKLPLNNTKYNRIVEYLNDTYVKTLSSINI